MPNARTVTWRQDSRMRIERASASTMGPAAGFLRPYLANPTRIKDERLDCHNEKVWQIFAQVISDDYARNLYNLCYIVFTRNKL